VRGPTTAQLRLLADAELGKITERAGRYYLGGGNAPAGVLALVSRGWIARAIPDAPDGFSYALKLTEEGRETLRTYWQDREPETY
jgi:hypothetical protein